MLQVKIDYTNWRGERSVRTIIPKEIIYSSNEYHKEEQWLLVAEDCEKNALRTFAMKDIHSWK